MSLGSRLRASALAALLLPAVGLPAVATAQPAYDLQTVTSLVDDVLTVTVQIRMATTPTQAGTGNLVFTYNDAALATPSGTSFDRIVETTDFTPLLLHGGAYQPMNVVRNALPGNDEYSINVELNSPGTGTVIGTTFTDLVRFTFDVTDPGQTSQIAWLTDDTRTILLDGTDDATQLANGTFTGDSGSLPVELTAFTATRDGAAVRLAWTTASETRNAGFGVEHAAPGADFAEVAFVAGKGTTSERSAYALDVPATALGTHRFRLRQVDVDGATAYSPTVEVAIEAPRVFALAQNAPNPAAGRTRIGFTVPEDGPATVDLYDLLGRRIARLFDGVARAGQIETVDLDTGDLATGVYVYRLSHGSRTDTRTLSVRH